MPKEGYWIKGDQWQEVVDHARWMIDNNIIGGLNPHNSDERAEILLIAMSKGYIRVRAHGTDISFEFSGNTDNAMWDIYLFLSKTQLAGSFSHLTINNIRTRETIGVMYSDFVAQMKSGDGLSGLMKEKLKLNYDAKLIERIEKRIDETK